MDLSIWIYGCSIILSRNHTGHMLVGKNATQVPQIFGPPGACAQVLGRWV